MAATSSVKSTRAAAEVSRLIRWWYGHVQEVKNRGGKIAWTLLVPHEICHEMDIVPIHIEQFAAMCAARQVSSRYCSRAESDGYSRDICGYCKTILGYSARFAEAGGIPPEAPLGGAPRPDFLLGRAGNLCDPGYKWYQATLRYLDTPVTICDRHALPDIFDFDDEDAIRAHIAYNASELRRLVAFLEQHTGRKLNMDRLAERVADTFEMNRLAYETWRLRQAVPSPMPSQDHFATVFVLLTLPGTKEGVEFFRKLHDEVKSRVDNNVAAFPDEKYRLQFEGIPPWHNMSLFNYLEKYGAVFAGETLYTVHEPLELNISDPIQLMAERPIRAHQKMMRKMKKEAGVYGANSNYGNSVDRMLGVARDFKMDGMVLNTIRSCRVLTIGHLHTKNVIRDHLGLPSVFIEGDFVDPREYNEAETKAQLDSFMEVVSAAKEKRLRHG